jgi:5S rRNA maturation endonuclease (ribonuclease M5)
VKDPNAVLERLEDLLERLSEAADKGVVLVEGRRDEAALRALGIQGEVVVMNQGLSLLALSEELACGYQHVALMVDWDAKGDELARKLRGALHRGGLALDFSIREALRRLTRGNIHAVEELASFHRRVRAAAEAKGPLKPSARSWRERKEENLVRRASRAQHGAPPGPRP